MHNNSIFLNYWNVHQTFNLKGICDRRDFARMLNILKSKNANIKIEESLACQIYEKKNL